ncbi:hypothetical protein phytr_4480 [Candidatus Phycorickettsia trachydisci]|uniref:Ankyrin repeat-containing protein n=1 Tax=Candidatus Phycorickettsia trachydisci TaxID=2115978 RepID=A0A2P1P7Z8_9RICK|nr:hypothetical protein [Candidatus Phycorickettsia trachydisci]AVP87398.1 hypothetical protein phytr_4480 [Candidatus Phycorickettsia trachydisci]
MDRVKNFFINLGITLGFTARDGMASAGIVYGVGAAIFLTAVVCAPFTAIFIDFPLFFMSIGRINMPVFQALSSFALNTVLPFLVNPITLLTAFSIGAARGFVVGISKVIDRIQKGKFNEKTKKLEMLFKEPSLDLSKCQDLIKDLNKSQYVNHATLLNMSLSNTDYDPNKALRNIRFLLNEGIKPDNSVLKMAIEKDHFRLVELLLKPAYNLNLKDEFLLNLVKDKPEIREMILRASGDKPLDVEFQSINKPKDLDKVPDNHKAAPIDRVSLPKDEPQKEMSSIPNTQNATSNISTSQDALPKTNPPESSNHIIDTPLGTFAERHPKKSSTSPKRQNSQTFLEKELKKSKNNTSRDQDLS